MSISNITPHLTSSRHIFLSGALVLFAVLLVLNLYLPRTTYAVTPSPEANSSLREKLATTPSIWPVNGSVTSSFGWRNSPLSNSKELHAGIDIAINSGTPVVATADGRVVQSGPYGGYGNLVACQL